MQVREYVVRRLLKLPLVLIAVTLLVFALSRLGGSPIGIYLQHDMSQEEVAQLEERYGVNDPLPTQYVAWLGGVLRGDLGWSGVAVAPVSEVLPASFVATMELAIAGAVIAIGLGVGLGDVRRLPTQQAGRPHHPRHHRERRQPCPCSGSRCWRSSSSTWSSRSRRLGRFDQDVYGQITHYTGFYTLDAILNLDPPALWDSLTHLALPAFVLGFEGMAVIARMVRSSLVEEMGEDYVDSARAKGLPERDVIRRHARRNALVPSITVIGLSWGILLQGTVVVELVFRWPGMGRWATDAILRGDRATIMAFVLVTSVVFLTREPPRRHRARPSGPAGGAGDMSR